MAKERDDSKEKAADMMKKYDDMIDELGSKERRIASLKVVVVLFFS